MSSALTKRSSSHAGDMSSTPNSEGFSLRFAAFVPLPSGAMWSTWNSATSADIWSTHTTHAVTDTALTRGAEENRPYPRISRAMLLRLWSVPVDGSGEMDEREGIGTVAGSVFPCGVYATAADRRACAAECA